MDGEEDVGVVVEGREKVGVGWGNVVKGNWGGGCWGLGGFRRLRWGKRRWGCGMGGWRGWWGR